MAYEKVRGSRVLDDDEDVTLMSNPGAVLEALVHLSTILLSDQNASAVVLVLKPTAAVANGAAGEK